MEAELGRIYRLMAALALVGTVYAAFAHGAPHAAGFALGSAGSFLNFRWLKHLVEALGPGGRKPSSQLGVFLAGRYLIFGVIAYVIVRYFGISPLAALAGLLVAVAAVIVEIVYELIYAGT